MHPLAHRRPGYPSVGLLASRARLRFTRRPDRSKKAPKQQEQGREPAPRGQAPTGGPLNPGGSRLLAEVGPFCLPITTVGGVEFGIDGNKRLLITARDLRTGRLTHKDYPVVKLT